MMEGSSSLPTLRHNRFNGAEDTHHQLIRRECHNQREDQVVRMYSGVKVHYASALYRPNTMDLIAHIHASSIAVPHRAPYRPLALPGMRTVFSLSLKAVNASLTSLMRGSCWSSGTWCSNVSTG